MKFKITLAVLLLATVVALPIFAQESSAVANKPSKFDEFGEVSESEFGPKLKNFFDALRESEDRQGFIVLYGGASETPFKQTDYYLSRRVRALYKYIQRRFDDPRITFARGGLRETPSVELWIGPRGAEYPFSKEPVAPAKKIKNKLELLGAEKFDFAAAKSSAAENGASIKSRKSDADFARVLSDGLKKDGGDRRAVLIFYADEDKFDVEKSRQTIEKLLQNYAKNGELDTSRVRIVYGGYREKPEIETWILAAADGIEPEPVPDFKVAGKN